MRQNNSDRTETDPLTDDEYVECMVDLGMPRAEAEYHLAVEKGAPVNGVISVKSFDEALAFMSDRSFFRNTSEKGLPSVG